MTLSLRHPFVSGKSNGADPTLVQPSDWNAAHTLTQLPGTLLGALAGGAGQTVEIPISVDATGNTTIISTGFLKPPIGTTGQRPGALSTAQMRYNTTLGVFEYYDGAAWQSFASQAFATANATLRGYIDGLQLSAAGGSASFGIAIGAATDGTATQVMALAAAITKTTGAWAVGSANGGLDTGVIAPNTVYFPWLIKRLDTGVVDVLFSLSPTAPTMPASYTLKRRIGGMKTDGASQWIAFVQDGDTFQWVVPVVDVNAVANPGAVAVARTLSVPVGIIVQALVQLVIGSPSGSLNYAYGYLSDLATADIAVSSTFTDTASAAGGTQGGVVASGARVTVRTDVTAQIRSRLSYSDAVTTLTINTLGWIDRRGRDS